MLVLELTNIFKQYEDRVILEIKELKVYGQDKVGIVGLNGSGKTTLLNLMSHNLNPDMGTVKIYGKCSYITQFDLGAKMEEPIDWELASKFNITESYQEYCSGGEKTRYKIGAALSQKSEIFFADEPTANLDLDGLKTFEELMGNYQGVLLMVSHDRELLDRLCNKILEIDSGRVRLYQGNYSSYLAQKEAERKRQEVEYGCFSKEKAKLISALHEKAQMSQSVKKTPSRMGNSEARLHKMGNQRAKANLDRAVQAMESRIDRLEVKENPKDYDRIKLDLSASEAIYSKVLVEGKKLDKFFGQKIIFNNAEFSLLNGEKTALIGDNGSGKSTLIKIILGSTDGIKLAKTLRIGYFSQDLNILHAEQSVLENLMGNSSHDQDFVRTFLARLLFKREDVYKKVSVLSGGERVRASLGKVLLSDFNLLILDEPTNYLDVYSLEAIERVLADYPGNLFFVSHDRRFVDKIATNLLLIRDNKLVQFRGNYAQYLNHQAELVNKSVAEHRMLLQHRLSDVLGRLAVPSKHDDLELLDQEYKDILRRLKEL